MTAGKHFFDNVFDNILLFAKAFVEIQRKTEGLVSIGREEQSAMHSRLRLHTAAIAREPARCARGIVKVIWCVRDHKTAFSELPEGFNIDFCLAKILLMRPRHFLKKQMAAISVLVEAEVCSKTEVL